LSLRCHFGVESGLTGERLARTSMEFFDNDGDSALTAPGIG
jgi:hypothetical protein